MRIFLILFICWTFIPYVCLSAPESLNTFPKPGIEWNPETYMCLKTEIPLTIDGKFDEPAWEYAGWTDDFVDIEGSLKPEPRFRTRVKMLWDNDYFYCGAELEEPHIQANLTERDSVIFYDNDFEVFIDPDGDTHNYYELEINALGTVWDLFLVKPYRDGGPAINAWDIQGLKTAVYIDGTLNNPDDIDKMWTVEIAIPWKVLGQAAGVRCPPENNDQWKINFSRVEWQTRIDTGKYTKVTDPETGKNLPEDNWVWSPQGLINMHYPEMWGIVQFHDGYHRNSHYVHKGYDDNIRWILRRIYYYEKDWFAAHGSYCSNWNESGINIESPPGMSWIPEIEVTKNGFEATICLRGDVTLSITEDGRIVSRKGK